MLLLESDTVSSKMVCPLVTRPKAGLSASINHGKRVQGTLFTVRPLYSLKGKYLIKIDLMFLHREKTPPRMSSINTR